MGVGLRRTPPLRSTRADEQEAGRYVPQTVRDGKGPTAGPAVRCVAYPLRPGPPALGERWLPLDIVATVHIGQA